MNFPNLNEFNELNKRRNLVEIHNELLNVKMISGDNDNFDANLISWQLIEISSKLMKIQLYMNKPLIVSQGDMPDKIVV